jgi:hypothetical protein
MAVGGATCLTVARGAAGVKLAKPVAYVFDRA